MSRPLCLALVLLAATEARAACGVYAASQRTLGAVVGLIGAAADEGMHHPEVGMLVWVGIAGEPELGCSATLVAPDVLLTAAHCVPPQMDEGGWLRPDHVWARWVWTSATRPFPLGRQRTHEVVAGARLQGYSPDIWRMYESPLFGRYPRNAKEREVLAAFESACGDSDRLFETQARLRCLAALAPAQQRALGFADADWNARDVGLLFLDHPVSGLMPARIARPLAPDAAALTSAKGGSVPAPQLGAAGVHASPASSPAPEGAEVTVVGYGWSWRLPELRSIFVHPWGTRRASRATVFSVGNHQLQLEEEAPTCYGDSGGPVLQRAADGAWQVVGISSGKLPHRGHLCGTHATYMRADAVRPWVEATMAAACGDGRRSAAGCLDGLL